MSGQLIGGVIGAAAGFAIGQPALGFAIGSTLGGILDPAKTTAGPTSGEVHFTGSSFGLMLPIVYGDKRMQAGPVWVWAPDLVRQSNSGGKGGPSTSTETLFLTGAIKLCKAPIVAVVQMWNNGKKIYDNTPGQMVGQDIPMTVYLGDPTSGPDPTWEAAVGVGKVPAFRDDAGIVFDNWDVTQYGGWPNLSIRVQTNAGQRPARVSTYTRLFTSSTPGGTTYDDATGLVTATKYTWNSGHTSPLPYTVETRLLDGTIDSTSTNNVATIDGASVFTMFPVTNDPSLWYQSTVTPRNGWIKNGVVIPGSIGLGGVSEIDGDAVNSGTNVYAVGVASSVTVLRRFPCPSGYPAGMPDVTYSLASTGIGASSWRLNWSNDGFLYAFGVDGSGTSFFYKFNPDLTLAHDFGTNRPTVPTAYSDSYTFMVWDELLLVSNFAIGGAPIVSLYQIDEGADTFTLIHSIAGAVGDLIPLGDGLASVANGIVTIFPPAVPITLGEIVSDVHSRCGTQAIDVSTLIQQVPGFEITQQMTGRDALNPLMGAYFVDAAEVGTVVQYVIRGSGPAVTIPDGDMAARARGSDAPSILMTERAQEDQLPRIIDLQYVASQRDFQNGIQTFQRNHLAMGSQNKVTLQFPIVMADADAKRCVELQGYNAWFERDKYTITLGPKYGYLVPTDVISCRGIQFRIVQKNEGTDGVIQLVGVRTHPNLWVGDFVPGIGTGFTSTTTTPTAIPSLILLDSPKLTDSDFDIGLRAASTAPAELFKSSDGGTTYASIGAIGAAGAVGVTSSVLGSWAGGDYLDPSNSVTVVLTTGELDSVTELALYNGANLCCIGGREWLQFRLAALIAPNTYLLSDFLRGRFGTEFATVGHFVGEQFVLMPATNIACDISDIGQVRQYKAVAAGQSIAGVTPLSFVNTGVSLRMYSPCEFTGGVINSSGDVLTQWKRRTRSGGALIDYVDVPLVEATELYVWQAFDSTGQCVHIEPALTSPNFTYTGAQQTTDFGSLQLDIFCTVVEIGKLGPGIATPATILGAGSSNAAALSPIPPYGYIPPVPPSGPVLPITADTLTWPGPTSIHNIGFSPGTNWDIAFTPAAGVTAGTIQCAEYTVDGSGPVSRTGILSLTPGGPPILPSCSVVSNTISFNFFLSGNPAPSVYPTLTIGVTYYVRITTSAVSSMYANLTTH